ncbi:MAG: TldD/PmbA family protein [Deltaproteobacteria bacterium]|nr:TldD/PmbA family protein [Deltaproteobacteria bacterium]MCB9488698.1 TldD/PmbA family protein [Deltaproteobacteria bacterium]
MKRTLAALLAVLTIALSANVVLAREEDRTALLKAMQQEMERSRTMHLGTYDPPYFVAYQMQSSRSENLTARFGAIFDDYENNHRDLYVEVRVGDYTFDSSGKGGYRFSYNPDVDFHDVERQFYGPKDDDATALRGQLWLATDQAYKNALSSFLSKKSSDIYTADAPEDEQFDDFSRQEPARYFDKSKPMKFDKAAWTDFIRDLSAELKDEPELLESTVRVSHEVETRYFINTEGTVIVDDDQLLTFYVYARALAVDGMELEHSYVRYAGTTKSMPTFDELRAETTKMVSEIKALRTADKIDPYSGPAILDPQTTGTFFHEAIGHRLEGERMRDTQEGQTFKGKVGKEILPTFISVYDDPTLQYLGDQDLNGYYRYDSEGVPAQRVTLVDHGVLRNYLLSRAPIPGFDHSNGHGRNNGVYDPMARMANTIVESDKQVSAKKLKAMLIDEVKRQGKPFGLILKRSMGGETSTDSYNFQAFANKPSLIYKVDPDTGEETLVRGAELVGTPLVSISKLIATDETPGIFNGFCGAESGYVPVSAVAPSALVSEVELQRTTTTPKRPPVLDAPFRSE